MYFWIFFIWIFILIYEGLYTKRLTFWDEVKLLWKCTFFATLTIMTILFIGQQSALFSRTIIVTMAFCSLLIFPVLRINLKKVLFALGFLKRKLLIVGAGDAGKLALSAINHEPDLGYEVTGFIDDDPTLPSKVNGLKVHCGINQIHRYIKRCGIHDILVAKPELDKDALTKIIGKIQHTVENTLFVPDLPDIAVLGTELRHFFRDQTIVIEIKNNLAKPVNYIVKRLFDFIVGFLFLSVLTLPLLIIYLLIRLTSPGPAIFKQERIGKYGRSFVCYKFRTMRQDAEQILQNILEKDQIAKRQWGEYRKLIDDPRITRVGKFLRETSLDELPQIFNVMRGDMSLIGPRPVTKEEIEKHYQDMSQLYLSVPPGITGLWQVSGRSDSSYEQRISLDSWYVRNWNLWLDIMILFKTIKVVLKKQGAR